MIKKLLVALIGINIFSISINILKNFNIGMGSFDSLTLAVQKIFNIKEFGNAAFIIHLFFFTFLMIMAKRFKIRYSLLFISLLSIFVMTRFINLYGYLIKFQVEFNLLNFAIVFLTLNFGLFLMMKSNLIIAPFDKFVQEVSNFLKKNLGIVRFFSDVALLVIVLFLNYVFKTNIPFTAGTIFITFFTGFNMGIYDVLFGELFQKFLKE